MTMTTVAPFNTVATVTPSPAASPVRSLELIDIHRRAGHLVAELSTGPAWVDADRITTRLIAEAQAVATLTAPADAVAAPAVVRCRELAVAQRRMVLALEDDDGFDVDETAVVRARALLAELAELGAGPRGRLPR
jgi:hypothetical protein